MRSFFLLSAVLVAVAYGGLLGLDGGNGGTGGLLSGVVGPNGLLGNLGDTVGSVVGDLDNTVGGVVDTVGGVAGGLVGTVDGLTGGLLGGGLLGGQLGGLGGVGSLLGGVLNVLGGVVSALGAVLGGLGTGLELGGLLGSLSPAALANLTAIVNNPNATIGQIESEVQNFANSQGPDVVNALTGLVSQITGMQGNLTAAAASKSPATQGLVALILAIENNPALNLNQVFATIEALVDNALELVKHELQSILDLLFGDVGCILSGVGSVGGQANGSLPLGGSQAGAGNLLSGLLGQNGLVGNLLRCTLGGIGGLGGSNSTGGIGGVSVPPVSVPVSVPTPSLPIAPNMNIIRKR